MIGCRHNAKNTLEKNYLFFAEKWGAKIRPQAQVVGVEPIEHGGYQVRYRSSTNPLARPKEVRCDRVVVAAGVLGTLDLLLKARDEHGTLRQLSDRLGENVRTNSEALLGVSASEHQSEGVAISAVMQADEVTQIEAFRYPAGSSLMYRLLGAPLSTGGPFQMLKAILQDPLDFVKSRFQPGWGDRVAGLLVMQTEDHKTSIRRGRRLLRKGLVRAAKRIPAHVPTGHEVVKRMASQLNGKPLGNLVESLFDLPITAHILGGVPMGRDASEGVIDTHCEVFGYPGLFVVDGSIVPANPGLNPSLTIAALAEYAMSHIPEKETSP